MQEIRDYAAQRGCKPATVLQQAAGYGGTVWEKWEGGAQCTMATADKIRKHMQDHPCQPALVRGVA